ncbi:MAG: (d)CMP kinase [bacterium]|nr:(d)CMP kinase [bacterium]
MKDHIIIAIDGPAGSGKSTIARNIAQIMNLLYIDTGAMYRAITYCVLLQKIDVHNKKKVNDLLLNIQLILKKNEQNSIDIYLNNHRLTGELRGHEVEKNVSLISSYKKVREYLVQKQRTLSQDYDVILDGRDIGTVVFPNTKYKFYLDASAEERARRRFHDKKAEKGLSIGEIKDEIIRRDEFDKNREISPLKKAEDAVYLDTTQMNIEEVSQFILEKIRKLS